MKKANALAAQQYKIPAVATAGVLLPWIWSIGLVPSWISALSALGSMLAVMLLVYAARPVADAADDANERSLADSLHTFLHRWSGMAHQTQDNLQDMSVQIHGVMEQTEQAVLNLSGSFRNITAKTNEQMTYAMSLLQNTHGIPSGPDFTANAAQSPSLPEYIRANEEMTQRLADAMGRYNEVSLKLLSYENQMQAADQGADELFTRLNTLLRKISVNAASTPAPTEEAAQRAQDALRFEQELHEYVRALRGSRSAMCKNICNIASEVKDAGDAVRREMTVLATSMRRKNEEVAGLVGRINALGEEVRKDIYKVIVELQFQDITHQKLERVRTPLLNELGQGLRAIAQETHVIYEKLRRSVLDRGQGSDPAPSVPTDNKAPVHHLQSGHQKPELGNKVELF